MHTHTNLLIKLLTLITTLLVINISKAEENLWVYGKGTDTRPKGSTEIKLNSITRIGKRSGDYVFHDIRPEIEYGLANNLTIGAELLFFDHNYSVDPENGPNPMRETQALQGGRFNKAQFAGYEVALKYNLLSPYKDPLGLSLGFSYEKREKYRLDGSAIDQDSFVPTLYLQKNFLDDLLVLALTTKIEFERRKSPGVLEEEIALDISAGISYRIKPKWFIGLEFRHQSDYLCPEVDKGCNDEDNIGLKRSSFDLSDIRIGTRHQYGNYLGPTFHYAEKNWWLTVGVLWQINGGGSHYADVRAGRSWDEHERIHIGTFLGYEF